MTALYLSVTLLLLLTWLAGLIRVVRGPTAADRVLATQLLGTTGTATLLLLSFALGDRAIRDVGLVLALFALITAGTFVRRLQKPLVVRDA